MRDLTVDDLLDDINTDVMTPAWVCFDHEPGVIAENAYAGLLHEDERVFEPGALKDGGFEVIVSGHRKGTGSSRETAPQCERWSGIRIVIAASFAPIHERNNINLGQVMGDHEMLQRLQDGESIPLAEFTQQYVSQGRKFEHSSCRWRSFHQRHLRQHWRKQQHQCHHFFCQRTQHRKFRQFW